MEDVIFSGTSNKPSKNIAEVSININNETKDGPIQYKNLDQVEIRRKIEKGLTGIVGPNGCGKSNIVESLRWVMGETSAKSMRGSGMEDVIFSGTSNKPSKNIAEVSININNETKDGPIQYNNLDQVEIRRKIEKDKGSKF